MLRMSAEKLKMELLSKQKRFPDASDANSSTETQTPFTEAEEKEALALLDENQKLIVLIRQNYSNFVFVNPNLGKFLVK
jgi:hypothetical protein